MAADPGRVREWLPPCLSLATLAWWAPLQMLQGPPSWVDWLLFVVLTIGVGVGLHLARALAYLRGRRDQLAVFASHAGRHLIICGTCGEQLTVTDEQQVLPAMTLHAERDCRGAP